MCSYKGFTAVFALLCCIIGTCPSRVYELGEHFDELEQDDSTPWLVKFYTPWCGHCKRLEPVWAQVAQHLYRHNIRVGRVDCSRYAAICSQYGIIGSPTIKFLDLTISKPYTYHGDRTKNDIIDFALRLSGPIIEHIVSAEQFALIKHTKRIFFIFIGDYVNDELVLWYHYRMAAEDLRPHANYFLCTTDFGRRHLNLTQFPVIIVYKESIGGFYMFAPPVKDHVLNQTLRHWINRERFDIFEKITKGNINDILSTGKYIVVAVVAANKRDEMSSEHSAFRDALETIVMRKRDTYRDHFQFGWTVEAELANSLAMKFIPVPNLMVYNSTSHQHHMPDDSSPYEMTPDAIETFLDRVLNRSAPVYGGDTYTMRLYRTYFNAKSGFIALWRGNPALTSVIFGLPFGFFCIILYSICCADVFDADEGDDSETESLHEKRE